jgi:hypothetical protein
MVPVRRESHSSVRCEVSNWPIADMAGRAADVRLQGQSGRGQGAARLPLMTPEQTLEPKGQQFFPVLNVIQLARILAAMW